MAVSVKGVWNQVYRYPRKYQYAKGHTERSPRGYMSWAALTLCYRYLSADPADSPRV